MDSFIEEEHFVCPYLVIILSVYVVCLLDSSNIVPLSVLKPKLGEQKQGYASLIHEYSSHRDGSLNLHSLNCH